VIILDKRDNLKKLHKLSDNVTTCTAVREF